MNNLRYINSALEQKVMNTKASRCSLANIQFAPGASAIREIISSLLNRDIQFIEWTRREVASFGALANQLAHRVAARELLDECRPRFLVADLGRHGSDHRRL